MIVLARYPDANRRAVREHASLENAINRTRGLCSRTARDVFPDRGPRDSPQSRRFSAGVVSARFQILSQICPPTHLILRARKRDWGLVTHFKIGVSIMRVDHPQINKRDRRAEPSFWVDEEPTDDALSLLENALRGDEPALRRNERADEAHSLIEENARLRELLSQLSDIIRKNGVHAR
jgi:hypothetical protein